MAAIGATSAPTGTAPVGFGLSVERAAEHLTDIADRATIDPAAGLDGIDALLTAIDRLLAVVVTTLIAADGGP